MKMEVNANVENKIFQRKEIRFSVTEEPTPSRAQISIELCKKLNLSPDTTIVVKVDQLFGSKMSVCMAHSYQNRETLEKFEPKHILKRYEKGAAPAAEEAAKPAEAAPAAPAKA
jgi:small subunit ribosomal protein S24e